MGIFENNWGQHTCEGIRITTTTTTATGKDDFAFKFSETFLLNCFVEYRYKCENIQSRICSNFSIWSKENESMNHATPLTQTALIPKCSLFIQTVNRVKSMVEGGCVSIILIIDSFEYSSICQISITFINHWRYRIDFDLNVAHQ